MVLSNHFTPSTIGQGQPDPVTYFLADFYRARDYGEKVGLTVILGAELRFTDHVNDYLVYGITPEELYDIYGHLSDGVEKFSKYFRIPPHIFTQAHPFRTPPCECVSPDLLDGVETFNMHPGHNSRVGLAARFAREHDLIATCGSDFHHPGKGHEGLAAIRTKTLPHDSVELAAILRSRDYLFDFSGTIADPYGTI